MNSLLARLESDQAGQDVVEHAVKLSVVLALAIATVQLVGSHAGDVFSRIASAIQ